MHGMGHRVNEIRRFLALFWDLPGHVRRRKKIPEKCENSIGLRKRFEYQ